MDAIIDPACLPSDPKPWDASMFDTMTAWADVRDIIIMDKLCSTL